MYCGNYSLVAVWSKAQICSRLISGIAGLNPADVCFFLVIVVCCVGSGLCDVLITHSEGCYWVCVI